MTRAFRRAAAVAGGLTLAGTLAAAPAQAQPAAPLESLYASSDLVLAVSAGTEATHTQRAVTLRCAPTPGGDHPAPDKACHALRAVHGHFKKLSGPSLMCMMIYAPVTATAQGVWDGKFTSYRETFANACVMHRERGVVFDF